MSALNRDEVYKCEQALMGALMLDPVRIPGLWLKNKVQPFWFKDRNLAQLSEVAIGMIRENCPVDPLSMLLEINKRHKGDEWSAVIEACIDLCPTAAHAEYYIGVLWRESLKRSFQDTLRNLHTRSEDEDPTLLLTSAADIFQEILKSHEGITDDSLGKILGAALDKWRKAREDRQAGVQVDLGVPMPWFKLTKALGGLPNDLIVLAARPSVGKTALEGCIRTHAAMNGYPTLGMLMDMGADRVLPRDLCRMAKVSILKLKMGYARMDQLEHIEQAKAILETLPMHFVQKTTSLEVLAMRARSLKAKGMLRLITVDHAQLCGFAGSERLDMRARVTHVTAFLKALAQELEVPVLLLSQLRRADSSQELYKLPELDDLRDSGSLEQDAAIVMMMHTDFQTMKKWAKDPVLEQQHQGHRATILLIRKNQDGPIGHLNLLMNPPYFIFNMADENWNMCEDDNPASLEE